MVFVIQKFIHEKIYWLLLQTLTEKSIENSNRSFFCLQVQRLEKKEALLLNIGSMSTGGVVMQAKSDIAVVRLQLPVCTELGEKVALSRRIDKHWRYKLSMICYIQATEFNCGFFLFQVNRLGSNQTWKDDRTADAVIHFWLSQPNYFHTSLLWFY